MGRFYETTPAKYVDDLMYDLPYDEISKLIKEKQTTAQDAIDTTLGLSGDAKFQYIQNSETDVNLARQEHDTLNKQVNDLTQKIKEDAANANIYQREINDLKVSLNENLTSGNMYKLDKNYKEREKRRTEILERAQKEGLPADEVQRLLQYNDLMYQNKGGVIKDGVYNEYQFENLIETENIAKHGEDLFKGMMGKDFEKIRQTDDGFVDETTGEAWEGFDEKRINEAVNQYLANTKDLTGRMSQLHKLGLEDTPEKQAEVFRQFMQNKYGKHKVKEEYRNKIGAIAIANANRENQADFDNQQEINSTADVNSEVITDNLPKDEASLEKNIAALVQGAANLRQQSIVHGTTIVDKMGSKLTAKEKELLLAGDTQTVKKYLGSAGMTPDAMKEYNTTATKLNWDKNYYQAVKEGYLEAKKTKGKGYTYNAYMADVQFKLNSGEDNVGLALATYQGVIIPPNVNFSKLQKDVNLKLSGDDVPADLKTTTMETAILDKNGLAKVTGTAYFVHPKSKDAANARAGNYIVTLEGGKQRIVTPAQIGANTILAPGKRLGKGGPKILSVAIPVEGNDNMIGTVGQVKTKFYRAAGITSTAESEAYKTKVGTTKYAQSGNSGDLGEVITGVDAVPSTVKNNNGDYYWQVRGKVGNNNVTFQSPMGAKYAGAVTHKVVQEGRYGQPGYEESSNATLTRAKLPVNMIKVTGDVVGAGGQKEQITIDRGVVTRNGKQFKVGSAEAQRIIDDFYLAKEGANNINWHLK